MEEPRSDP
jgi:hypothetical protein